MNTQETLSDARSSDALVYPTTPVNRRTFSIEDAFYEYARELGNGNASKGVRIAMAYHARHSQEHQRENGCK